MAAFKTLEDIEQELVRKRAQSTAKAHLRDFGRVKPTAFVLSTYDPTTKQKKAQVESICVGGDGTPAAELRSPIRFVARKTHAVGVVFMRQEGGKLLVSLEHVEHGDFEWQARAVRRVIEPLGDAAPPTEVTRFLPRRYLQ